MRSVYLLNGFNASFSEDMDTDYGLTLQFGACPKYRDKSLKRGEINKTTMFFEVVKWLETYDCQANKYSFFRGLPLLRGVYLRKRLYARLEEDLLVGHDIVIFAKSLGAYTALKVLDSLKDKYEVRNIKLITVDAEDFGKDRVYNPNLKYWFNIYQTNGPVGMGGNTFNDIPENYVINVDGVNHKNIEEKMRGIGYWEIIIKDLLGI